jgi:broad specificity phosphatase PhoE
MTKFLLIRHAAHDLLGKVLTGRAAGLHLNAQGKLEAERLADRLAVSSISAIYTGPLERARETAEPLWLLSIALSTPEGDLQGMACQPFCGSNAN